MSDKVQRSRLVRLALLTLGWCFIVLGVIGLFLPILQGVLFLLAGLYLLSNESRTARRLLQRLRRRFPRVDARLHAWRERIARWLGRLKRKP